jgi:hypothetical protein
MSRYLLLRNTIQVPALAGQAYVQHIPQLDTRVRYVFNVANIKSLGRSKDLGGLVLITQEILELLTKKG